VLRSRKPRGSSSFSSTSFMVIVTGPSCISYPICHEAASSASPMLIGSIMTSLWPFPRHDSTRIKWHREAPISPCEAFSLPHVLQRRVICVAHVNRVTHDTPVVNGHFRDMTVPESSGTGRHQSRCAKLVPLTRWPQGNICSNSRIKRNKRSGTDCSVAVAQAKRLIFILKAWLPDVRGRIDKAIRMLQDIQTHGE
jgi:hypothetical protein